jgi:hypothetical protein
MMKKTKNNKEKPTKLSIEELELLETGTTSIEWKVLFEGIFK